MFLLFTFSDGTTQTSDFILDSSKITESFYNELKYADDSAMFKIPFNETLCDKIKAEISKNIKVQIKEDGTNLFTGYLRKTVNFSKTQRNQPFSVEVVSPALMLEKTFSGTVQHYSNTNLADVVLFLLSLSNFSGNIDVSNISNQQIKIFMIHDGETIKEVLSELLFEYGYTFNFDGNGKFYVKNIFDTAPLTIEQKFNGDNCLKEIQQNVKEDKYDRVKIKWNKVEQMTDVLIFEDTTGANENEKANITINPQSYYLEEQKNYLQYDSKFQSIIWIDSAVPTIKYDLSEGITRTFSNLGTQGELSIYNSSSSARTITELSVRGSGYFETSTNETKVGSSGTESEITAKYIQTESDASRLAKKMADYYNYSNFSISVKSKTKYDLGSFVEVSDSGIGTIRCRVVKRTWNIQQNNYDYTLESITEYDPHESYTTKQNVNSRGDNGETIRDTVTDLSHRIDEIATETTMVFADVLSAIIKLDNEGKTITTQDITTTVSLKQSDVDLDFSIGSINLPEGWTYTINGKQIVFHIAEGVSLRSGRFAIPVLYRTVMSEEQYVDENGNIYVDENNIPYAVQIMSGSYTQWKLYFNYFGDNGGIYLGMFSQLSQIPSQNNYGDFFTWGGTTTESDLSYDGAFLQGRVYKYIGTKKTYQWSQDTDGGHGQIALSDVLGIAGADLKNNNATVYEYLDHLTSNSIYSDMIVSNKAYIDSLVANTTFINELSSNTAFIQNLASNDIFAETIKATDGFFENITITGLIAGASGRVHNLTITGDSHFEGTIDSGPLLLSSASPQGKTYTYSNYGKIGEMNSISQYNGVGTYGDYSFDNFSVTTTNGEIYYLKLFKNGGQVYDSGKIRARYVDGIYCIPLSYTFTYTFTMQSNTKTFKLRNLPQSLPAESGVVYVTSDGTLKVAL